SRASTSATRCACSWRTPTCSAASSTSCASADSPTPGTSTAPIADTLSVRTHSFYIALTADAQLPASGAVRHGSRRPRAAKTGAASGAERAAGSRQGGRSAWHRPVTAATARLRRSNTQVWTLEVCDEASEFLAGRRGGTVPGGPRRRAALAAVLLGAADTCAPRDPGSDAAGSGGG